MVLSPMDIHDKEFSTKMRGYNIDEVNDFLDQVIKDYQITLKENKELTEKLTASDEKLKYFNDLKDSLNQSIIVAQEAADKVRGNSQREAEIITQEAQKQASDIVTEATEKANDILDKAARQAEKLAVETDDLKKSTRVFRQRLQVMLESQLEVTKGEDWDKLLQEGEPTSYSEIRKLMQDDLDSDQNASVDSEDTEILDADQQVAADADSQTVVIFPEDDGAATKDQAFNQSNNK
ncbi:cell division initiation protein [Secundilactobacillus oryzae JCM 18671]|uniref:Cell division initiation protein n=1 Tax=Secundilactobacillus oryzae JCM 18671 TaxID=1291743 RepID=A0A081BGM4_9LACO|nr:DivIVA domain-containing protein [Secundilactobacillus oryzae]GAK47192.1 cell division initiation protein [Secundilactobacillus oryzae JCM 18671]